MSAPPDDARPAPDVTGSGDSGAPVESVGPPRERAGCALGISLGLLALLALVLSLLQNRARTLEPGEALGLASIRTANALPFDLEPVEAAQLPDGTRLVRFAHPDYVEGVVPEEFEGQGAGPEDEQGTESDEGDLEFREPPKLVEPLSLDSPPVELIFTIASGPGPIESVFGPGGWGGGTERLDEGELRWGDWQADYLCDRARLKDGHFRESIRVNLSAAGSWCMLAAQWPVDHAASTERMEELLQALLFGPESDNDS